jgi:PadR family transcriptional regulator, regulatory protein PadR
MPPNPLPIRITRESWLVVDAIASGVAHGFDIIDATGLPSGTVYPILRRLDAFGLVRSRWEVARDARDEGRPPRRLYELTASGRKYRAAAAARFAAARGELTRARPAT